MKQKGTGRWIKGLLPVIIPVILIVMLNTGVLIVEGLEWIAETFYHLGYKVGTLMKAAI